jgi:hypothetical protein
MLTALVSAIITSVASSIVAAYFRYRAQKADEQLKQQVPVLEANLANATSTIAQRDDTVARLQKTVDQLNTSLEEARKLLADQLGPEGARKWLQSLLDQK